MKKLFIILIALVLALIARTQTVSEITNIINTKPQSVTVTSQTSNNTNLFSIDLSTSGYKVIQLTLTGTWSATVSFQGSPDNFTTVDALPSYQTTAGTWSTTTTANGTFAIPCYGYRYIRARVTSFTSGTVAGTAYAKLNNAEIPGYNTGTITTVATLQTGSNQIGHLEANQSINVAQINGVTTLMGNGVTGTGSQRVTIASDNSAISVNPLSATAPVNTMNSASANSGLNSAIAGLFDDVSPTLITENNFGFLRMSANHNLYNSIRDAAGNERGANVNSSNELLVALSSVPSHAVTNGGTFVVQENGSALTSLQLIDNIPNTLGSTTSGQSGVLSLGAVTTSAPSYTTAQTNALSLQTDGSLRTAVTNTVTVSATNLSTNVAQINGVTPLMGNGTTGTGSPRVTLASDGTAISTTGYMSVKFDQTTLGTTNGVTLVPATSGGYSVYHLVSAGSTNATSVKGSAGQLYGYYIFNANAAARKVAFHNTSGTPTAGSSIFFSLVIPAGSGANVYFGDGIAFSSGIGITTVTGTADSDATGVASGDLIINLFYK